MKRLIKMIKKTKKMIIMKRVEIVNSRKSRQYRKNSANDSVFKDHRKS